MIKSNRGFTLIEVLATMAIIGIAAAITLVSISGGRVRKEVEGDARRLVGTLRELQNNSLAGKQIVSGRVSCGFFLLPSAAAATTITSTYTYRTGATCSSATADMLSVFKLTPGVSISVANIGVGFMVPWGKLLDGTGGSVLVAPVQYRLVKSGVTWSVCVYPEGRIEETVGASCPA